jgi:predicted NBD/HSP70 family sugar kinase
MLRIGIDLGGTKIEAVALGPDNGVLRAGACRRRGTITPARWPPFHGIVEAVEADLGAEGMVGVGRPGAISPATGLVTNANSVWLNGRSLAEDLEQMLGRPVRLANDANCFALSEASDGAAAGATCVFGVIVGTGTGGGIVVGGRVLAGPHAIAGEWGHNPMPWPRSDEWLYWACVGSDNGDCVNHGSGAPIGPSCVLSSRRAGLSGYGGAADWLTWTAALAADHKAIAGSEARSCRSPGTAWRRRQNGRSLQRRSCR